MFVSTSTRRAPRLAWRRTFSRRSASEPGLTKLPSDAERLDLSDGARHEREPAGAERGESLVGCNGDEVEMVEIPKPSQGSRSPRVRHVRRLERRTVEVDIGLCFASARHERTLVAGSTGRSSRRRTASRPSCRRRRPAPREGLGKGMQVLVLLPLLPRAGRSGASPDVQAHATSSLCSAAAPGHWSAGPVTYGK